MHKVATEVVVKRLVVIVTVVLALVGGIVGYIASVPAFGKHAKGSRQKHIEESPQWHDGKFENYAPMWTDFIGSMRRALSPSPDAVPRGEVPRVESHGEAFVTPPASGLRVTWFGHASSLIELDEVRVLTDPFWSERTSPVTWAGPRRFYPPVLSLDDLPAIDAVLVSHDHYDHLDMATVSALAAKGTRFIVPLGIGAHLAYWGVPAAQITELDWWQAANIGPVDVIATPARHASGRLDPHSDQTLWAGYAVIGKKHRAYYSGDTGFFDGFAAIGEAFGPFDVTLIESGQYNQSWPDWHLGPEQAVEAHVQVRGVVMLPVHWGLLSLAPHSWTEPVERVLAYAACRNVNVLTPRPGESIEPELQGAMPRWWPSTAWTPGADDPIIASKDGNRDALYVLPPCATP